MARLALGLIFLFTIACVHGNGRPRNVILEHLGCEPGPHVGQCLRFKFSKVLALGKYQLVMTAKKEFGGRGYDPIRHIRFPPTKISFVTVSGSNITVHGLRTLGLVSATMVNNKLSLTLRLAKLRISGVFHVKAPFVGKRTFPMELKIDGLRAAAAASFTSVLKPQVKDVKVTMSAKRAKAHIKGGGLLNALASRFVNNNKTLNSKSLPWLSSLLESWLKRLLTKYVSRIKY